MLTAYVAIGGQTMVERGAKIWLTRTPKRCPYRKLKTADRDRESVDTGCR